MVHFPLLALVLALAPQPAGGGAIGSKGPAPGASSEAGKISLAAAEEILRKSDIAALAPESFRARLRIAVLGERPDSMEVEVWRSGESRSLVRFLGPKEMGKYLVRLDGAVWFLAPGAKKPVKLNPAYRLRGSASLDEILGIHYARDYAVEAASQEEDAAGPLIVLDLAAKSARAPYPRIRYVVRRQTERPVRAEYRMASGKTSSDVEFLDWAEGSRPVVKRLILTDRLRSRLRTEVSLLEMEERKVPDGLFDLENAAERKKIEEGG